MVTQAEIEQCIPGVQRLARSFVRRLPAHAALDVDDLQQAGMIGVLAASRRYVPRGAAFETVASCRAKGEMLELIEAALRPKRNAAAIESLDEPAYAGGPVRSQTLPCRRPNPQESAALLESCERLDAAIAQLTAQQQLLIRRYYAEDRTLREVGAELGVSESRVSQTLSAAVSELKETVAPWVTRPTQ